MAKKSGSVDPSKFPIETFDLYSIPAFDRGEPDVVVGSAIGSSKQIVKPGDVLLSRIVPHIRRAGVVGHDRGRRIIASGEWIVFRSDKVHPAYLRHVLVGDPFHAQFMNTVAGVGGSLLRARPTHVANITVPLPPLPEQRRTANILDQAEALRAKRRVAPAEFDTLTASRFVDMFGDPESNPKGWPIRTLGSLVSKIGSGATPRGGNASYIDSGISLIRSLNVHDGQFRFGQLAHIDDEQALRLSNVVVQAEDVLLNITGASVARVCRVPVSILPARVNQHVCIIRPTNEMLSIYCEYFLMDLHTKGALLGIAESGATRQALTKSQISNLPIPLPPKELQAEFSRFALSTERLRTLCGQSKDQLDALFASLQHQAFRGEL